MIVTEVSDLPARNAWLHSGIASSAFPGKAVPVDACCPFPRTFIETLSKSQFSKGKSRISLSRYPPLRISNAAVWVRVSLTPLGLNAIRRAILLHAERGNHLLLFLQFGILKPARFQFRNALMQRTQELTEVGEIPLVHSFTMRPLIAASDSRAPSKP